jgi:hypothetical protein
MRIDDNSGVGRSAAVYVYGMVARGPRIRLSPARCPTPDVALETIDIPRA